MFQCFHMLWQRRWRTVWALRGGHICIGLSKHMHIATTVSGFPLLECSSVERWRWLTYLQVLIVFMLWSCKVNCFCFWQFWLYCRHTTSYIQILGNASSLQHFICIICHQESFDEDKSIPVLVSYLNVSCYLKDLRALEQEKHDWGTFSCLSPLYKRDPSKVNG